MSFANIAKIEETKVAVLSKQHLSRSQVMTIHFLIIIISYMGDALVHNFLFQQLLLLAKIDPTSDYGDRKRQKS